MCAYAYTKWTTRRRTFETPRQQLGHAQIRLWLKISSESPEKRGNGFAIPGLVVQLVIQYTSAASIFEHTKCILLSFGVHSLCLEAIEKKQCPDLSAFNERYARQVCNSQIVRIQFDTEPFDQVNVLSKHINMARSEFLEHQYFLKPQFHTNIL